ncbi:MAG: 16S rRNA (cytidine(1402)-2'-O)-methyltransferase [Hyphomicrobiales bacterium]
MTGQFHIGALRMEAPSLPPGLYLVATPIGNLGDVTLRALETLAAADIIYCEDTRITIRLLERYGLKKPLKPLHDHNEAELAPHLVAEIEAGKVLALVSDAGTPLISDPGYRVMAACAAAGVAVTALPGASAVLTALQLSGLATDAFSFAGFLPERDGARRQKLETLLASPSTVIVYESPHRLREALSDIAALDAARPLALARELTKLHEEVLRGRADDILTALAARDAIKGECALVIAGKPERADVLDEAEIARIIADAAAALPASKAAREVAKLTGLPRDEAFARILQSKGKA